MASCVRLCTARTCTINYVVEELISILQTFLENSSLLCECDSQVYMVIYIDQHGIAFSFWPLKFVLVLTKSATSDVGPARVPRHCLDGPIGANQVRDGKPTRVGGGGGNATIFYLTATILLPSVEALVDFVSVFMRDCKCGT